MLNLLGSGRLSSCSCLAQDSAQGLGQTKPGGSFPQTAARPATSAPPAMQRAIICIFRVGRPSDHGRTSGSWSQRNRKLCASQRPGADPWRPRTISPRVPLDSSGALPLAQVNQEPVTDSTHVRICGQYAHIYTEQGLDTRREKQQLITKLNQKRLDELKARPPRRECTF